MNAESRLGKPLSPTGEMRAAQVPPEHLLLRGARVHDAIPGEVQISQAEMYRAHGCLLADISLGR
jgi:hypothetical protein